MDTTYCVRRVRYARETIIVAGLQTMEEALRAALSLYDLQNELGGDYDFCVEPE